MTENFTPCRLIGQENNSLSLLDAPDRVVAEGPAIKRPVRVAIVHSKW